MRKKLAFTLIVTLILTILPFASTFAASANRVTSVVQVAEDVTLTEGTTYLVIEDNFGDLSGDVQRIRLDLSNAEWAPEADWNVIKFRYYDDALNMIPAENTNLDFIRISPTRLDLEFEIPSGYNQIRIPMLAKVSGLGAANVTIDRLDSAVTGGTYQFATGVGSDLIINIAETINFGPGEVGVLANITIDEAAAGNLALTDSIRLTLPSGFEWAEGESFRVRGTGGFMGDVNPDQDDYGAGTRDLEFTLTQVGITRPGSQRGTITLSNLAIFSDSTAFGDVMLTFGGDIGRQTLEIAGFTDFDLTVEADGDPEMVVAGRFDGTGTQGYELATLVMKEEVADSWIEGRAVTVEFPNWVKITSISGVTPTGFDPGDSSFSFTPSRTTPEERMEYEIEIEAIARADAEGDMVATITSRGFSDTYRVVLGEAVAPVEVETGVTEILVTQRDHNLDDIVIEETMAGGLMTGTLEVKLGVGQWAEVPTVTVDEGDLEIGDIDIDEDVLTIEIERASGTASVLIIEEPMLELVTQPLLGDHDISVGGDALVRNNTSTYFEDDDYVVELPVLRVVSQLTVPATTVSFTVGQAYYFADGQRIDLDVAPYIKDGRLMVPVAHVSRALGIPRDDVIWDGTNRTVTVLVDSTVMQMTIGSQYLVVGGVQIDMEAAAEITNDRTFVPISRFARAIGIDYTWDPDTETVVFNQ